MLRREAAKEAHQNMDNLADQVVPLRVGLIAKINRELLSISVFEPLLIALILSAFHFFILGATAIFVVTLPLPEPSHPLLAPKITIFLTSLVSIIRDKRQTTSATFFNGEFMLMGIALEELQVRKQYLFRKDQLEMGGVLAVNK